MAIIWVTTSEGSRATKLTLSTTRPLLTDRRHAKGHGFLLQWATTRRPVTTAFDASEAAHILAMKGLSQLTWPFKPLPAIDGERQPPAHQEDADNKVAEVRKALVEI